MSGEEIDFNAENAVEKVVQVEKPTRLQVQEPVASPMIIIQHAIMNGIDIGQLEKLMAMQERFEERESKKLFDKALSGFKANPPRIVKDKLVDFKTSKGRTTYKHATIGAVCEAVNVGLGTVGMSASWRTDQVGGGVKVTCILAHEAGHSEETSLQAPPDSSGGKNLIQAICSTVSYLERYTLLAITGIATHDQEDDDGRQGDKSGNGQPQQQNQKSEQTYTNKNVPSEQAQKCIDWIDGFCNGAGSFDEFVVAWEAQEQRINASFSGMDLQKIMTAKKDTIKFLQGE